MKAGRFRIRITKTGKLFIALIFGVGIASINTGNNLLYLVFAMMLSFLILSGLLSNNTLTRLRIFPRFPRRVFAGQTLPVHIDLTNNKRIFPSFSLSLSPDERHTQASEKTYVLKIPPKQSLSAINHIKFLRRGRQKLPDYGVETLYPFGFIEKKVSVPVPETTIVYPKLIRVDSFIGNIHHKHGEYLSGERGESANPYGIRDFAYGDNARLIHWKSSAKSGKWKIKEFEKEKRLRVQMQLLLAKPKDGDEAADQLAEKAVSATASILIFLSSLGYELALSINEEQVKPEGRGYMDSFLTALALAKAEDHPTGAPPSQADDLSILVTNLPRATAGGAHYGRFYCSEDLKNL